MSAENQIIKPWKPDRPTSKGATAYHEAVFKAKYYIEALDELVKISIPGIREGVVVVDFGAGTGVSAMRLLAHLKINIELWLVDNSHAWLGKAYEVLGDMPNVKCFILEKRNEGYDTLADAVGKNIVDYVISANTLHLVPDLKETFSGIFESLKDGGSFIFQSGNITRHNRPEGVLLVDDSAKRVHDIALDIVRTDPKFAIYRENLDSRIKMNESQRKFVFPGPRPIEIYIDALRDSGFEYEKPVYKLFKVKYSDWLNFLRVRRLQAGILPEIGGHEPSPKEESDRDALITLAANRLFKELQSSNPMADGEGFTIDSVYLVARKPAVGSKLLSSKTALVTGASRGIGKAIALEFARQGADVIVNYSKDEKGAFEVVSEIKKLGRKSIAVKADVSDFDDVSGMIAAVKKEFGRIDVLVNNAGIIMDKTLQNMEVEEWNSVIKTNLSGVFNVTRNAVSLIGKNGRIINISSIVGLEGNFGQANYAASKAGIIGFTKSLAKELGKHGITVNAIAPGFIETDILKSIPPARKKEFLSIIPLGRIGSVEDIANAAVFLASNRSSYITGEVLCVTGGLIF